MAASSHPPSSGHTAPPSTPEAALRVSQVICIGLIIGLLMAGGVMGFMGLSKTGAVGVPGGAAPAGGAAASASPDPFVWLTIGTGFLSLIVVMVVPGLMAKQARKRWEARADDEMAMRWVYQGFVNMSIVQAALLEGAGLLGAVATMETGNTMLLLAPGLSVVFLAVLFPRRSRIDRWIEEVTGVSVGAHL